MHTRPRLTPAVADVRRAVRESLTALIDAQHPGPAEQPGPTDSIDQPGRPGSTGRPTPLVLVALSGGADSLALAIATAFEAPRTGFRAGAIVVDHGLQAGSAEVAARASAAARELGLNPVSVVQVQVGSAGGPEAAARDARYEALGAEARRHGASAVLAGHTLDDQAETVLLGLARGAGAGSLQGMSLVTPLGNIDNGVALLRPLLGIRRSATEEVCAHAGREPWSDPHNLDPRYARVRARSTVLPLLETELGPGVVEALARTAEQLREDTEALDLFAAEMIEDLVEPAEAGLSLSVAGLAANPPAVRNRLIRLAVASEFGVSLSRAHTLQVARLVTGWRGQGPLDLPGIRAVREGGRIAFSATSPAGPEAGISRE